MKKLFKKGIFVYLLNFILVIAFIIGNIYAMTYKQIISVYFGHSTSKVVSTGDKVDTQYYKTSFSSKEELKSYSEKLAQEIVEEGVVLLKNDNKTLPLSHGAKVTLLGQNSVDLVYGGGGAGSVDTSKAATLLTAFQKSGFNVNDVLWDFYRNGAGSSYRKKTPDVYGKGAFEINEVPINIYTEKEIKSFSDCNDAAIVVIGRSGGESSDLSYSKISTGYHYLQIDDNEKALLKMACDNFKKVIVILNSSNPIELGFLNEYNISACIWVGAIGQMGAYAIADVLNGKITPSGKLPDTYAYDLLGAPSMANFGDYTISNSKVDRGNKYMVYSEGIYVGYRYYETRYEDVVLGNENKNEYDYSKQVQFPFGYGLSYTTFEWSNYNVVENSDFYEVSLKVTNNGDFSGKEIVQIYMQSPYTEYDKENDIEKPSIYLVGFAKTSLLKPGESEVVKIKVNKEEMKVYDSKGYGTYIVDAGDYYLAAGKNAHDALNNILVAKGKTLSDGMDYEGNSNFVKKFTVANLDYTKYSVSSETGNKITNQFEGVNIEYYDPSFKYLSRKDWKGTWPKTYKDGNMIASDKMLSDLNISYNEDPQAILPVTDEINSEYGQLNAAMFIGREYNDELWDVLLNQLTVDEMMDLVRMGGYATIPVASIGLPATVAKDGPAGISNTLVGGGESGMAYPAEVVLAATWNIDLALKMGEAIGEDSLNLGVHGWYAPAANIHRSPFGGRNFEYYSEDSFLSGMLSANEVKGAQSKGVIVFMKHFALNDQETNRLGCCIFANEQSVREVYLKPFEITVRNGKSRGVMASMNRIGARWTGGHKGLMTETLRNEWGFNGLVITDQASFSVFAYEDLREGIEAGTNLWLNTDANLWKLSKDQLTPTVINNLRKSVKDIIYAIVNSNAMNGLSSQTKIVKIIPIWQYWLIILDILIGIYVVISTWIITKRIKKNKIEV